MATRVRSDISSGPVTTGAGGGGGGAAGGVGAQAANSSAAAENATAARDRLRIILDLRPEGSSIRRQLFTAAPMRSIGNRNSGVALCRLTPAAVKEGTGIRQFVGRRRGIPQRGGRAAGGEFCAGGRGRERGGRATQDFGDLAWNGGSVRRVAPGPIEVGS